MAKNEPVEVPAEMDDGPDPVTQAYRDGYVSGYEDGVSDGRYQGYADAKWRAHRAVENDPDAQRAIVEFVGEI